MHPVIEYFICVITTPLLSEFPLHILELVDKEDTVGATHESVPNQFSAAVKKPGHEKSACDSLDPTLLPHHENVNNGSNNVTYVDATAQRNTTYGTMLAIVAIPLLYMLWQVIFFTCEMQLSERESLLSQCFYWIFTLATAARLIYGLSACARFYVYVFRPRWLPDGTPLGVQTFEACGTALAFIIKALPFVIVGLVVKVLVYDNLVKVAVTTFGVQG
jgi:hypothetical protein